MIGYYLNILDAILNSTSEQDSDCDEANLLEEPIGNFVLLYNVYIRIGDLYRYSNSQTSATLFYHKALMMDERSGIAYNQISLSLPLYMAYKCLYFAVRSYHSPLHSSSGTEVNIRQALTRLDSPIFAYFRDLVSEKLSDNYFKIDEPETGLDWFYLVVISIHFKNFEPSFGKLVEFVNSSLDDDDDDQGEDFAFAMMALDTALDWLFLSKLAQLFSFVSMSFLQIGHVAKDY